MYQSTPTGVGYSEGEKAILARFASRARRLCGNINHALATGTFTEGPAMTVTTLDTRSARLRAKLAPLIAETSAQCQLIAGSPRPRATYRELLRLLHWVIRASVPLLRAAERCSATRASTDPVAAALTGYLAEHAAEETHHDEWLLDDYAAVGGDPAALAAEPGSPTAAALAGSQYCWIQHAHPVAILGYCAVLEGSPPTGLFVSQLERATGNPPAAFASLRHHSTADLGHRRELFDLIDTLPLTPQHEALVGMSALHTADLLITAGDALLTKASTPSRQPHFMILT